MANYFLPEGYQPQNGYSRDSSVPNDRDHQPNVYKLAAFLAGRLGTKRIVDLGCGSASTLKAFAADFDLVFVGRKPMLELASTFVPKASFIEYNLENGLPNLSEEILKSAVIICSNVVERLTNPGLFLGHLSRVSSIAPFVLISTPDRDRTRGLLDSGPPEDPAHIREWSASEFVRFLSASGFSKLPFSGHTTSADLYGAKGVTLVIAGTHTVTPRMSEGFRVAALISVFNEEDILPEVVHYLHSNGIEIHIFDNWSDDSSYSLAERLRDEGLIAHLSRFPEKPTGEYEHARQLAFRQEYAAGLDAHWVIHHDADEIRCSPWPGIRLVDAFAHIDSLGYNAADFTVIDFRFLSANPSPLPPYEESLNWYEFGHRPGHFLQIKAWKNTGLVSLVRSGGHEASFADRRVFPLKFLLKHYPLRSFAQAQRKVFRDRLPRFTRERAEFGWHVQYDRYKEIGCVKGWSRQELLPWHSRLFETEFIVERLSGIGLTG